MSKVNEGGSCNMTKLSVVLALFITSWRAVAEPSQHRLGLDIRLAGGSSLYMPVTENNEVIGILLAENEQIVAIRFMARPDNDGVRVDVTALSRNNASLREANYSEVKAWEGKVVGTFTGKEGDSFELSALVKFALPSASLKIIGARSSPTSDEGAPFCSGGRSTSLPSPGKCMGMAGSSMCCRAGVDPKRIAFNFKPAS
jgi:hypothetical protein